MALSRVIACVLACVLSTQAIKDSVTEIVSLESGRTRSAEVRSPASHQAALLIGMSGASSGSGSVHGGPKVASLLVCPEIGRVCPLVLLSTRQ